LRKKGSATLKEERSNEVSSAKEKDGFEMKKRINHSLF